MALALGGRRAEAERAYDWLADRAAHRRLVAPVLPGRLDRAGQARRQRHRLRGHRRVAPLPAVRRPGLHRGDVAGRRGRPSTSCSTCRRPAARSSGPATPTARRGRSPCSPARRASATACAAPSPWPSTSATSAPTGSSAPPAWPTSSAPTAAATCPTPSPPSTAGPWTGTTRCWPACCAASAGRERLDARRDDVRRRGHGRALRERPPVDHRGRDLRVPARLPVGLGERDTALDAVQLGPAAARPTTATTGPASCSPRWCTSPATSSHLHRGVDRAGRRRAGRRPARPRRCSSTTTRCRR